MPFGLGAVSKHEFAIEAHRRQVGPRKEDPLKGMGTPARSRIAQWACLSMSPTASGLSWHWKLTVSGDGTSWQISHATFAEGIPPLPLQTDLSKSLFPWIFGKIVDQQVVKSAPDRGTTIRA